MLTESYIWISLAKVFYMNPHFIACESLAAFGEALHVIENQKAILVTFYWLSKQTHSKASKKSAAEHREQTQHSYTPASIPATGPASLYQLPGWLFLASGTTLSVLLKDVFEP